MKKFLEAQACEDLKVVLAAHCTMLRDQVKAKGADMATLAALEKVTKVYAVLKDDLREDVKGDLWEKINEPAEAPADPDAA